MFQGSVGIILRINVDLNTSTVTMVDLAQFPPWELLHAVDASETWLTT